MIRLYDIYDKCVKWVHPSEIKQVHEQSNYHGGKSVVVLNGSSFHTSTPAEAIVKAIEEWNKTKEAE